MATGRAGKNRNRNRGNRGPVVVGPYDRPFYTPREERQEIIRRTREATVSPEEIRRQYEREQAGASLIGQTFQDMLAQQASRSLAAQQAIQGASGGAGAALTTSAVTSAQQAGEAVPLFAAGETARSLRDVASRRSEAEKQRAEDYRKNLAIFGQAVRDEEREKQAARIEREAAIKAYEIDRKNLEQKAADKAFSQNLALANYNLAVQREQRLADADTGSIDDLIKTIDDVARESSVVKGGGNATATVSWYDGREQKTISKNVTNVKLPYDPKTASNETKQKFWKNYVVKQFGVDPLDVDRVGVSNYKREDARAKPVDVARDLIDYIMMLPSGYSRADAVSAILRTPWGGANAKAVQAAARG